MEDKRQSVDGTYVVKAVSGSENYLEKSDTFEDIQAIISHRSYLHSDFKRLRSRVETCKKALAAKF